MSPFRRWRTEAGLTLAEVAGLTGYSLSFISRVERGERGISPRAKVLMARRLEVPIGELFDPGDVEDDEPAVPA